MKQVYKRILVFVLTGILSLGCFNIQDIAQGSSYGQSQDISYGESGIVDRENGITDGENNITVVTLANENIVPANTLENLIGDMTLPHEQKAHGRKWPSRMWLVMGNNAPDGWEFITPWGQAYEVEDLSPSVNTLVSVSGPAVYIFSKSKQNWIKILDETTPDPSLTKPVIGGAMYYESFAGDTNFPLPASAKQPDRSLAAKPGGGLVFHYWSSPGKLTMFSSNGVVNNNDIGGIFVTFRARLIVEDPSLPDDRDIAQFIVNTGADYWSKNGKDDLESYYNPGIGGGRFKTVTKEWQHFNFCTMTVDELLAVAPVPGVVGYPQSPISPTPTPLPTSTPASTPNLNTPIVYRVIEGDQGVFNGSGELRFRIDADFHKFTGVANGSSVLPGTEYGAYSGSTIVVLSQTYLQNLADGAYSLTFNFTDGVAYAKFYVSRSLHTLNPSFGTATMPPIMIFQSPAATASPRPTATPGVMVIVDEKTSEGTEEMPITGQNFTLGLIVVCMLCAAAAISVFYRRRRQ